MGESDLPHIMALVQHELSEPYVIYTYRYFLHQLYVCSLSPTFLEIIHTHKPFYSTGRIFLTSYVRDTSVFGSDDLSRELQAFPAGSDEPVGVIVCKQSLHHENRSRNRGYIAMLSVHRNYRKRGIGRSHHTCSAYCGIDSAYSEHPRQTISRQHAQSRCCGSTCLYVFCAIRLNLIFSRLFSKLNSIMLQHCLCTSHWASSARNAYSDSI